MSISISNGRIFTIQYKTEINKNHDQIDRVYKYFFFNHFYSKMCHINFEVFFFSNFNNIKCITLLQTHIRFAHVCQRCDDFTRWMFCNRHSFECNPHVTACETILANVRMTTKESGETVFSGDSARVQH